MSSPSTFSRPMAVTALSTVSPALPAPPPPNAAPMSSTEIRDAFSFLPHIHALLTTMQYSSDPAQHSHHTTALVSQLTRAHSLLDSLPAIAVSSAEQQVEYDRLCMVRGRKRELLACYKLDVSDETPQRRVSGGTAAAVAQKVEAVDEGGGALAMEVGT